MALKPIYAKRMRGQDEWIWGLDEEDFKKVAAGYACARCLEEFEFYVARCPVCKNEIQTLVDTPEEWRH
jgi:hypothetical protein